MPSDDPTSSSNGTDVTTGSAIIGDFTSAASDQVGVMIGEDTRAFMQSMEQIYVAATAKALAMIANEATMQLGETLLTQIQTSQTDTLNYATGTSKIASAFVSI